MVASWPRAKSVTRALRYDGIIPQLAGGGPEVRPSAEHIREIAALARKSRPADAGPFDIVIDGVTPGDGPASARAKVGPLASAGATWWIEANWMDATVESLRRRIAAGPPA